MLNNNRISKIKELKALGYQIKILDNYKGIPSLTSPYDIYMPCDVDDEKFDKIIDDFFIKIKNSTWLTDLKSLDNVNVNNICKMCSNYNFIIKHRADGTNQHETIETCTMGHFDKTIQEIRPQVQICKDFFDFQIKNK